MSDTPIRLVCFDWGGVILRHCRSWAEGVKAAGLDLRGNTDSPECQARRKPLGQAFQIGLLTSQEFFEKLHDAVDRLYTIDELHRIHDAWLLDEYPGVDRVIDRLHKNSSITTALLSNTNERHWSRHIPTATTRADFPTAHTLHHRHASHLLRLAKPASEIYSAFEEATGFAGAEILFFDDLPDNIATAACFGWRTALVDHTRDTAPQIEHTLRTHELLG